VFETFTGGSAAVRGTVWRLVAPMVTISAVLNVLTLSGSFFMMIVYDEVLPGRSVPTLVGLSVIVAVAYAFQAVLEVVRGRAMLGVGASADRYLSGHVFGMLTGIERRLGRFPEGFTPLRDLDGVRGFLSGPGPLALLDLPWVVIYLALLFAFHWTLGVLTLAGLGVLVALAVLTDRLTGRGVAALTQAAAARAAMGDEARRHAELVRAHGMAGHLRDRWRAASDDYLGANLDLSRVALRMQVTSRTFRGFLQSMTLACGAALVINDAATGGVILAGSILSARALAPVEQTIASWKSMLSMRESADRLGKLVAALPPATAPLALPAPCERLAVEALSVVAPGGRQPLVQDASFVLAAGNVLAMVGASGSGKSTLARALTGVWPAARGAVRLDGATLDQWSPEALGRHIGFMPQSTDMLEGSVAQNIARFDPAATPEAVIAAARQAGLHDLILRMERGYDTPLTAGGGALSSGQAQRLALARALYGDPFLLVLDEPNAHLDRDGEAALAVAIRAAAARGAIVVIVSHRPSILAEASHVMILQRGRVAELTSRDAFLRRQRDAASRVAHDAGTADAGDARKVAA
jgi:ATP-binding cassette subfamily C protein